jgi:alkylation response protein AidB-like acyl-CoA dehydrogenase
MEMLRSTAREYIADRYPLAKVRELMVSEAGFERDAWDELAQLGWTGLAVPEEFGGAGYGPVEMSVVLEEMGRMVTPGPFFASVVLATTTVLELGDDDQRSAILPDLAAGGSIGTVAVHEGPRDWGLEQVRTKASFEDGGWVLEGEKHHVLDGHLADLLLVVARLDDGLGVFAVDARADGVVIEPVPVLDPTRRQATVRLSGVRVGEEALLGHAATDDRIRRVLRLTSAMLAVEQAGGAQRCLEMAVEYAKSRHQFGRPIGSFQAIKHRCAEMLVEVENAKSVAYHAVRVTDDVGELSIAAPLAASVASEAYVWAAGENIQVHGGIGFTWEHDAHLYLKRAKSSSLLFGDPRHHRALLAEALEL